MRLRDIFAAILLIFLMLVSAQRLYSTGWTDGLGAAILFALLGSILGLLLGASRFNRFVTFLLGLGYSLAVLPLVTLSNLYTNLAWGSRLFALGNQLGISFIQLVTDQPVPDPTLFLVIAYVGYWFISLGAGYALTRYGKFARAVVPAGIVLVVVQLFDMREGDQVYILAVYIFLSLLLLGRMTYLRRRSQWKESRVWVSSESVTDLNLFASVAALALVALSWSAPVSGRPVTSARAAWERLSQTWREKQQELNKSIQSLQSKQPRTIDIYGDSLALGSQAATSTDVFMKVRAPLTGGADRYYWRVRSYEIYTNDQWAEDVYTPDAPFIPSEGSITIADPQGISAEFVFTIPYQNLSALVTPARPVWTNRFSRLTYLPSAGGKVDPIMFVSTSTIVAGQEYLVHADIYQPSISGLRLAGVNYPSWVTGHYLQLPPDLPPEIGALARQITAGATDPYDKAALITDWLRKNIKYSTTVEPPPAGEDSLYWFLFNSKTGFCNYYATAEVVMLRTLGIPARMVVGYAQGEFEAPNNYTIREKDAHAWPEVYFPDHGWEEFEPTASQPALARPLNTPIGGAGSTPTPLATPGANGQKPPIPVEGGSGVTGGQTTLLRLTIYFLVGMALIGLLFVAYFFGFFDRWIARLRRTFQKPVPVVMRNSLQTLGMNVPAWLNRWAYYAGLTPTERSFQVVYQRLHGLRANASPGLTPAEAAARLSAFLPEVSPQIQVLLHHYERSMYSQQPADLGAAHRAAESIRHLSRRAVWQAHIHAFGVLIKQGFQPKPPADIP